MSQEHRPSKRARTAEDLRDPPKHHEEFWLADGNIVLVARNVAFRVYRGLLAAQSTVFADMFASSSPDSDETIDGCAIVHVSDSPEDLAYLLRVLLPTTYRHFHEDDELPERTFDEVFAIIHLAHKYNVPDVQRQALRSLREYTFSDDFEKWEGVREESIPVNGADAIGAVNLARLLDVPEMLPIALYKCLSLGNGLFDGWTRSDGSVESLSQGDIKRCFAASKELSHSGVTLVSCIFYPESSGDCIFGTRCEDILRDMLLFVLKTYPDAVSLDSQVITTWEGIFDVLHQYNLCDACWTELRERDVAGRHAIWKRFPEIFDVAAGRWGEGVKQ